MTAVRALIAAAMLLGAAPSAWPCSVPKLVSAVELVQEADAIVKVRAERLSAEEARPMGGLSVPSQVEFSVGMVLKGRFPASRVTFQGWLTQQGEPNGRPVPYPSVRPSGLSGSCFAFAYKAGAEYLLFLKTTSGAPRGAPGAWTLYWAPLAPINEQLQGPNDAGELWVREQLRASNRQ